MNNISRVVGWDTQWIRGLTIQSRKWPEGLNPDKLQVFADTVMVLGEEWLVFTDIKPKGLSELDFELLINALIQCTGYFEAVVYWKKVQGFPQYICRIIIDNGSFREDMIDENDYAQMSRRKKAYRI